MPSRRGRRSYGATECRLYPSVFGRSGASPRISDCPAAPEFQMPSRRGRRSYGTTECRLYPSVFGRSGASPRISAATATPKPRSRRGDGAVPQGRSQTHRCNASRRLAEATKPNVAVYPPSLARWAREGLGERVGKKPSLGTAHSGQAADLDCRAAPTKNRRPHPHHRAARMHRRFQVRAHAHRQSV